MKKPARYFTTLLLIGLFGSAALPSVAQPRAPAVIDPELAQQHYRRGNTYNNLERYDDAAKEYELSITADPNFSESVRNLANIYYVQERYDETITMLRRYLELEKEPTVPVVASHNTLGQLLRDAQRYDEAIDIDVKAIVLDPENTSQVYIMANTYFNAGRTSDAIRIYETALTINPNDAFIHRSLGRMYEDLDRLEDALAQYRRATELDVGSEFYRGLVRDLEARLAQQ